MIKCFLSVFNSFLGQITGLGDTLIDCVTPVSRGRNFCSNQINSLNDPDVPGSVLGYKTVTGICNNIEPAIIYKIFGSNQINSLNDPDAPVSVLGYKLSLGSAIILSLQSVTKYLRLTLVVFM